LYRQSGRVFEEINHGHQIQRQLAPVPRFFFTSSGSIQLSQRAAAIHPFIAENFSRPYYPSRISTTPPPTWFCSLVALDRTRHCQPFGSDQLPNDTPVPTLYWCSSC
jgi:hypothetical protein